MATCMSILLWLHIDTEVFLKSCTIQSLKINYGVQ